MKTILFHSLIYPIVCILEFTFTLIYEMIGSAGYSILAVSIVVSFMVLPMYMRSDAIQERERLEQERLSRWVSHIRKTFRGDERFMILQEFYRQNHYHPLYVLRGSFSMLLEVPFFIAAYYFLSHLDLLNGMSFHFIRDLGAPDSLITVGSFSINVLPILMTLINFVSGAIYTKGYPFKAKVQLYGLAVLFLILLYSSPSGLVMYWTMNNLFSLLKNLFVKLSRNPGRDFSIILCALGTFFFLYMFVRGKLYLGKIVVFTVLVTLISFIPLAIYAFIHRSSRQSLPSGADNSFADKAGIRAKRPALFFSSAALLAILLGFVIPGSVISASPTDFIDKYSYMNPLVFILYSGCTYIGLFLIWTGVMYYLASPYVKGIMLTIAVILAVSASVNYVFFQTTGTINPDMIYDLFSAPAMPGILLNTLVLAATIALCIFMLIRHQRLLQIILGIALSAFLCMGVYYSVSAQSIVAKIPARKQETRNQEEGIIHLSRNGKNVVVIMLDRAIGAYMPYILKEKPEIKEIYSGFTFYPNCISFGEHTNMGAPALFGGYDYTPAAINSRKGKTVAEKYNESLCLLPALFSERGGRVTLCDLPYAGYSEISDYSIFDGLKNVEAYHAAGSYLDDEQLEMIQTIKSYQKHSFVSYSLFQTVPVAMKKWIYDQGFYRGVRRFSETFTGVGIIEDYSVLNHLSAMSSIEDGNDCSLFMIDNNLTHDPCNLQLPDYVPSVYVNNRDYMGAWMSQFDDRIIMQDDDANYHYYKEHYHVNVSALLTIGKWLEWLKENGVYENTKIIITADHGYYLGQFPDLIVNDDLDIQAVNPLLLVKDFGDGEFTVSDEFMTNADTPSLAVKGIYDDAVNPHTGNKIEGEWKKQRQFVTTSHHNHLDGGNDEQFDTSDGKWYTVNDDIFDHSNWKEVN